MSSAPFDPGPLADVTAEAAPTGPGWTLVFVRELRHPPERVWAALTEPEQVARWAPYEPDRDLGRRGDASLRMIDEDGPGEVLPATVQRAEAPTLLEHTWGDDLLRWELAPTAAGTSLTLRHTMLDRDMLPKVTAGWHLCLDVAERVLDGEDVTPIRGADAKEHGWDDLRAAYEQRLGASDDGPAPTG